MDKPYLDISNLAFASDAEQEEALDKYTDELTAYIKKESAKKKRKKKTLAIAIAIYLVIVTAQFCFLVPSTGYNVYVSSQRVPHKVTTITTYESIWNADSSTTHLTATGNSPTIEGRELNAGRFFVQILLTTLIYGALCYVIIGKRSDKGETTT